MPMHRTSGVGQDFAIGVNAAAGAVSHVFSNATGNGLEPRVARMLGRLNFADVSLGTARGLLTVLRVSGAPLLWQASITTQTLVLANSLRTGFPLRGLDPRALVDTADMLGVAAGPNSPVELTVTYDVATPLRGSIGTDMVPAPLEKVVQEYLAAGDLYGSPNFCLGFGEVQQSIANTAQTVVVSGKAPRTMELGRLVIDLFKTNGAGIVPGDFVISALSIAGDPLFATSAGMDASLLSPFSSDEDGLYVGEVVSANDEISISIDVAALGAGVSGIIQIGFFTQ